MVAAAEAGWRGGGSERPAKPADPDYAAGVKAIDAGQYAAAIPCSRRPSRGTARTRMPTTGSPTPCAGTAIRPRSIPIYQKALAIDPKHRGAHEYIGEAYLTLDNLPKAKEHLARLDKLCFFPCSQYKDLKKAVEAYESSGGKIKPTAVPLTATLLELTFPSARRAGRVASCRGPGRIRGVADGRLPSAARRSARAAPTERR